MKFYKRFIAIGLGVAISFTGTNMAYTWFSSKATLKGNIISFGDLYEENLDYIITDTCIYGSDENKNKKKICIKLPESLNGITFITIESIIGSGDFKGLKNSYINVEQLRPIKKAIHMQAQSSLSNASLVDKDDYITVTLNVGIGSGSKRITYIIRFAEIATYTESVESKNDYHDSHGKHRHLKAHWYLVETKELDEELKDGEVASPDQVENIPPQPGEPNQPESGDLEQGENLSPGPVKPEETDPEEPQLEQQIEQDSENDNSTEYNNEQTQQQEETTQGNDYIELKL